MAEKCSAHEKEQTVKTPPTACRDPGALWAAYSMELREGDAAAGKPLAYGGALSTAATEGLMNEKAHAAGLLDWRPGGFPLQKLP